MDTRSDDFLTNQEIFDIASKHLLTQIKPSTKKIVGELEPVFAYRGDDGAVDTLGVMLKDEEYKPIMDINQLSINQLEKQNLLPKRFKKSVNLLTDLQILHDCFRPEKFEKNLLEIANKYGLEFIPE